ncbi:MAG: transposase [Propionibacteriaceae bacterium]|nr:transposase [Propionibacteriaceae bacterium]
MTELLGVGFIAPATGKIIDQKALAERLLGQGVSLVGSGELLSQLTKNVLEAALDAEVTEHLGYEHCGSQIGGSMRNETRAKTVLTEISLVEIRPLQDRDGSLHTGDRAQTQAPPGRHRPDRALLRCEGFDDRGDRRVLQMRSGLWGEGLAET